MNTSLNTPYSVELGSGEFVWGPQGLGQVLNPDADLNGYVGIKTLSSTEYGVDPFRITSFTPFNQSQNVKRESLFPFMRYKRLPKPGDFWFGANHILVMHYHVDASSRPETSAFWTFLVHLFNYQEGRDVWLRYDADGEDEEGLFYLFKVEPDFEPRSSHFNHKESFRGDDFPV